MIKGFAKPCMTWFQLTLQILFVPTHPRALRSSSVKLLTFPLSLLKSKGDRAFSVLPQSCGTQYLSLLDCLFHYLHSNRPWKCISFLRPIHNSAMSAFFWSCFVHLSYGLRWLIYFFLTTVIMIICYLFIVKHLVQLSCYFKVLYK